VLDYLFSLETVWNYIEDEFPIISEKVCVFGVMYSGLEMGSENQAGAPDQDVGHQGITNTCYTKSYNHIGW
jgi:hypothetical protein